MKCVSWWLAQKALCRLLTKAHRSIRHTHTRPPPHLTFVRCFVQAQLLQQQLATQGVQSALTTPQGLAAQQACATRIL
jgi:hypothetical protein